MIIKHIIGNLGQEPKPGKTSNGAEFCKLSVGAQYFDKEKKVRWHNVTVWGKQAEYCSKYLKKGSRVFVSGECTYSSSGEKEYENISASKVESLTAFSKKTESSEGLPDIPF